MTGPRSRNSTRPPWRGWAFAAASWLWLPAALAEDVPQAPPPAVNAASAATAAQADVVTVAADASRALLRRFRAENPGAREHLLRMLPNAYEGSEAQAGLRLERVWVGATGTLLEISGLPRPGNQAYSAVIRANTFRLRERAGAFRSLLGHEGVQELRDRRGGAALLVRPGDTLYAWLEPVDDLAPFTIEHAGPDGRATIYFENVDPRFRERYAQAYAKATTPEAMKDFIVEFAQADPDKKVPEVFAKLIGLMRARNTFEGYYNAYLLLQDPHDATQAQKLARTEEHRKMIEHMAITTLVDKNRLFRFDFSLAASSTDSHTEEPSRSFFGFLSGKDVIRYANRSIGGQLLVSVDPGGPIKLRHGDYRLTFTLTVTAPARKQAKGLFVGPQGDYTERITARTSVVLGKSNTSTVQPVTIGSLRVAYLDRGTMGGYTATYLTGDGTLNVELVSVELMP